VKVGRGVRVGSAVRLGVAEGLGGTVAVAAWTVGLAGVTGKAVQVGDGLGVGLITVRVTTDRAVGAGAVPHAASVFRATTSTKTIAQAVSFDAGRRLVVWRDWLSEEPENRIIHTS